MADSLANAGYLVVMPDYFKGEPIPVNQTGFDRAGWSARHPAAEVNAITEATIKYLRNDLKVKKIGAVGYCFGGKYAARFSAKNQGLDAAFVAHPSNTQPEEWQAIEVPFSIAAAGKPLHLF
jgi:dienelactone hydrolase